MTGYRISSIFITLLAAPMKSRGLATQLIFFILTGTAVIFLAAFGYNYYFSKEGTIRRAAENAENLTQETVYRMEVIFRGVEKVAVNLAATVEHLPPHRDDLTRLLDQAVGHNPEIFGVAVSYEPYAFNPKFHYFAPYCFREGKQRKLTFLGSDSYQYFTLDWYQIPKELKQPTWSEPYYDEGGGNIVMSTFSVPFFQEADRKENFRGIVSADVSLIWLHDIVAAVKIYQSGYAFLISRNGVFVTAPEKQVIMRQSIFSIAEARNDPELRRIGQDMIRGREGFVPITDFFSGEKSWMFYSPMPSTGWSLGVVIPEAELFADVRNLTHRTVLILAIGLGFLGLLITVMSRRVTRPLRTLAQKTEAIAQGDFSATVPETGAIEVAHLARSFNRMGKELTDYIAKRDFIRDTFGRYVTQEVVKKLLESAEALEMGGETREVSLMMSDLRGFTALTADMAPEQVITFLNRYLGKMIEILLDYRAVIDEIIGDGILAFFGAPETMEDHPVQAVACALQMQTAMEELNALNAADGLPYLEMGIGVNTGQVVVGNIGSEKRTKYSVVGAHVNFTSRVESYALGGQVLIGSSTYQRVKDVIDVGDIIQAQMKGIPGTVTIYEVHGISGPYNIHLKDRLETPVLLPARLPVKVLRISEKIITGATGSAWITHLCETSALVVFDGELGEWEDVRLHFLDAQGVEMPGKIYGKVTAVRPTGDNQQEATIRFTSVSPQTYPIISQALGKD